MCVGVPMLVQPSVPKLVQFLMACMCFDNDIRGLSLSILSWICSLGAAAAPQWLCLARVLLNAALSSFARLYVAASYMQRLSVNYSPPCWPASARHGVWDPLQMQ